MQGLPRDHQHDATTRCESSNCCVCMCVKCRSKTTRNTKDVKSAVQIQRIAKGWLARRWLRWLVCFAVSLQRAMRSHWQHERRRNDAALRLQCVVRGRRVRKDNFVGRSKAVMNIQRRWRLYIAVAKVMCLSCACACSTCSACSGMWCQCCRTTVALPCAVLDSRHSQ